MINHVPTNIITGALGAGKTTLIKTLLANKPNDERWAVLVNEFGEVGIDAAILNGDVVNADIFIKEVPGGCMCCTSGLPMQIALNLLLAQARPHRLLIEPTGLGHPKEVLQTLSQEHYQSVLNIQATLTLIDIRNLENVKWRNHVTFREQMQIADAIVVTKSDLYDDNLIPKLNKYMAELGINPSLLSVAKNGQIDERILLQPSRFNRTTAKTHFHHSSQQTTPLVAPASGTLRFVNSGEGYFSRGWLCSSEHTFCYKTCVQFFQTLKVDRLKAVLQTNKGTFSFNMVGGIFEECLLVSAKDSRIELITDDEKYADKVAEILEHKLELVFLKQ